MSEYVITADSVPDYDGWGPDSYWSAQDWISWHKALKAKYGLDAANARFLDAYNQSGFGGAEYDYRTTDTPFRQYAKANGFYDGLFPGIGGFIARIFASGSDLIEGGSDVTQTVGREIPEAIQTIVSTLRILIPVALVMIALYYFYIFVYRKS